MIKLKELLTEGKVDSAFTKIIGLLRKDDIQSTKIFQSYKIKDFIYINDGNVISRFVAFLKAILEEAILKTILETI